MDLKTETKKCQNCQKNFTIEPDDFGFYEKIKVPPPTFCPECRFQRRLLFRNNRVFYKRECDLCKKPMISLYPKETPYTIYCYDCWFSDKWDVMSYGKEYDFSKPFFQQFFELQKSVPRASLYRDNFIQSDYCNYGKDFKECYLSFGGQNNERIYFGNQVLDSRDSLDISFSGRTEFSYEVFECWKSNNLFFSHHSKECVESRYLIDCRNCINCFGCVGLANKQYYIFNKPYTKDEYKKFLSDNNPGSYANHLIFTEKIKDLERKEIRRYARVWKSINSDGDDLYEARNTHFAFNSGQTEDSKFLFYVRKEAKDCYDCCFQGFGSELVYEIAHGFSGSNVAFGMRNIFNQDSRYNEECKDCKDIFGCEGLRKKQYCILNKQYSKEEYEKLLPKIIKHMEDMPYIDRKERACKYGEFFPAELSPFAYNETIAQEYFPLTKDEAVAQGYNWVDGEARNYSIDLENKSIPDNIADATEDIINKTIACGHRGECKEQCTEAFKIVSEEFKFYKRMNLPLPRLCPNCRHYQRMSARNQMKLWDRVCMCQEGHFHGESKCAVEFKTIYAPDRPETIYCEKCYQQEVY